MRSEKTVPVVPRSQTLKSLAVIGSVSVLFIIASYTTRFNPGEFLMKMENFWLFIFVDLLPPRITDWPIIQKGLLQTFSMAIAATLVGSIISVVLAFLGSKTTAPWSGTRYIIRGLASVQRNIPTMIWIFIVVMSFGIGEQVGLMALLISTCGSLTRSFIEVIDEVGAESLEAMTAVGSRWSSTITQVVIPASIPGFLSWLMYSLEVNIRSAGLVGAVGGGGIGLVLSGFIKQFRYKSAMGLILLIAGVVIAFDIMTNFVRKKVLS